MTDLSKIEALADRIVDLEHPPAPAEDTRPEWVKSQLTREDLAALTPDEITAQYDAGNLDAVLGRLNIADRELIERAKKNGTITHSEARHLAAIGHGDLVAALPVINIKKD